MALTESSQDLRPTPDPTVLTTEAVERGLTAERDYVDGQIAVLVERLHGIDSATTLRLKDVELIPGIIDEKIECQTELLMEKFASIEKQLAIAEAQRVEQKADSKTGLDAALSAQKEAASEQNKSNTLAISKSEAATQEALKKLEDLFTTKTEALADKVDDMKGRQDRSDAAKQTTTDNRADSRAGWSTAMVAVGIVLSFAVLVVMAATLYIAFHHTATPAAGTTTTPAASVICTSTYHPAPCP